MCLLAWQQQRHDGARSHCCLVLQKKNCTASVPQVVDCQRHEEARSHPVMSCNLFSQSCTASVPQVLDWQKQRHEEARSRGSVRTLLGRHRRLPDAMETSKASMAARAHALRAAINTPIQVGFKA